MISMHSNRVMKMLAALLVVCLLVSCVLAPPAHAAISEAVVITLGAAGVIAAILTAMGIRQQGNDSTYFSNLVSQCGVYLKGIGYVTADGKMKVTALTAGITTVASGVIDAIRNFLFTGQGDFAAPLNYDNGIVYASSGVLNCGSSKYSWNSYSGTGFLIAFKSYNENGNNSYKWHVIYCSNSSNSYILINGQVQNVYHDYRLGSLYCIDCLLSVSETDLNFNIPVYPWINNIKDSLARVVLPTSGLKSNEGIDVFGSGRNLDKDKNIDVIYPGWADRSVSVDTNIQQDLDNDGAIDNIITAGKYYPLTVPLDATDVITDVKDWSQEYAQTGTPAKAAEATHADTKDTTGTKEAADSFSLGGSGDYTFQVRDFFPFCVPFDLYDMLNCLAADPVAPRFDWVIPVLGNNYLLFYLIVRSNNT